MTNSALLEEVLRASPVIPIIIPGVSFSTSEEALNVAKALKTGGVLVLEILVRGTIKEQQMAIDSIKAIHADPETLDMLVCAGTIDTEYKMKNVVEAGADFMVAADANMVEYWWRNYSTDIFAPTGYTTSEIATLFEKTKLVKVFPANQIPNKNSYMNTLNALYGKRGSIILSYDVTEPNNIRDLQHPIVAGVAAAWMAPRDAIVNKEWTKISEMAKLSLDAARYARNKEFPALNDIIKALCELSGVEPATKDVQVQTEVEIPTAEIPVRNGFFKSIVDAISSPSACSIM